MSPVITLEGVGARFDGAAAPILSGVDLDLDEGELVLVAGPTGAGKSTLLATLNGLFPHTTGGTLLGRVLVGGRDTRRTHPRDLADLVGWVGQDPAAGFVTDTVEDELAYAMESLGVPPAAMRARVEQTLDLLGLAELRSRPLATLSGGQAQRVAIGSVLTAGPRILVLDEPTSALDPTAAEDVLGALSRLVHDLGHTVVLAEHRLERVVHHADRVVLVPGGGAPVRVGTPAGVLPGSAVAPPVLRLAELAGWAPPPLSVRDARRLAGPLRDRLGTGPSTGPRPPAPVGAPGATPTVGPTGVTATGPPTVARTARAGWPGRWSRTAGDRPGPSPAATGLPPAGPELATSAATATAPLGILAGVSLAYGGVPALDGVDLAFSPGTVTALMGRNGAGKSSLLTVLAGLVRPRSGRVRVRRPDDDPAAAIDPAHARPAEVLRRVGLVPQDPGDLLYAESVGSECAAADRDARVPAGTALARLAELAPGVPADRHPRDLSEGQRLCLALAVVLAAGPALLLLDEPTRGLDQPAKAALGRVVRGLAAAGRAVVLATHDVELAAEVADRVVLLADGAVVVDGPAAEVVTASPAFAPQVARILAPARWLTVAAVAEALAGPVAAGAPGPAR